MYRILSFFEDHFLTFCAMWNVRLFHLGALVLNKLAKSRLVNQLEGLQLCS
jgi:hypothetical protein